MDFKTFKASDPAREMFRKLGFLDYLEAADSWRMLRRLIVDLNDNQERGCFVEAARQCACSSGERILLHAILYVTDFSWLADEFAFGRAWQDMNCASGNYRDCVVACIAADI